MKTQVLIIGGGATGTGLARDLSLRGIRCILVEKKDINAGASGGNHGLLHSGARYVESDPASASECAHENTLLKRLAPHCIENTGGLFAAMEGDDENYIADFPGRCADCNISAQAVDIEEARFLEPELSDKTIAVYRVPDATIDPFKLSLENIAQAKSLGTTLLRHTRVTAFDIAHSNIRTVHLKNEQNGREFQIEADIVVNAGGAWAGIITALADIHLDIICSKGSLLVTQSRLNHHVINRLRKAGNADIVVPGGTVSILGTTSIRIDSPDHTHIDIDEIDLIVEESATLMPILETTRYIRAYSGVRPLFGKADADDDRNVSRGFALIDHTESGIENFITITGGKLTTYRLMAEKTADRVCKHLGIDRPGVTAVEPLPSTMDAQWTEPGLSPRKWVRKNDPDDLLLCECEMVPQSVITNIVESIRKDDVRPDLAAVGLRSRVGKGPCQGGFCSQRITSYLYDNEIFKHDEGLIQLREFLNERWRGQHPLLWDLPLTQFELMEAVHCGLFGLELPPPPPRKSRTPTRNKTEDHP